MHKHIYQRWNSKLVNGLWERESRCGGAIPRRQYHTDKNPHWKPKEDH